MMAPDSVIVIVGPTASGKSDLALRIAEEVGGEIVNADSMQVYRGMDIGTAKPGAEERARVPHHLLDCVDPDEPFSAADFRTLADAAVVGIAARGKIPIVAGGTGLYIRALLGGLIDSPAGDDHLRARLKEVAAQEGKEGLLARLAAVDPASAAVLHPNDQVRIIRALEITYATGVPASQLRAGHHFGDERYRSLKIGLSPPRDLLYRRIEDRVDAMVAAGLEAEVRHLLQRGYGRDLKAMRGIGYKEMAAFLAGETTFAEAVGLMKRDTRRYAKRQLTWFKKDVYIKWFESTPNSANIFSIVMNFLEGEGYG